MFRGTGLRCVVSLCLPIKIVMLKTYMNDNIKYHQTFHLHIIKFILYNCIIFSFICNLPIGIYKAIIWIKKNCQIHKEIAILNGIMNIHTKRWYINLFKCQIIIINYNTYLFSCIQTTTMPLDNKFWDCAEDLSLFFQVIISFWKVNLEVIE